MGSLDICITDAKAWAEKNSELKLRPKEIEDLGRLIEAAHDAGATAAEKNKLMQDAVSRRIELTQTAQRGEKYLNTIKHLQNLENAQKNMDLWGQKSDSPVNALRALITGESSRPGFGVNQDPLAASRANFTRYLSFLENALDKSDLKVFKALSRGDKLSGGIDQELAALRNKTQSGLSGDDQALRIARKVREAQDAVFNEAKAVNPYLRENTLYLSSRSWNRDLVNKVSKEEFIQDIKGGYGKNLIGSNEHIEEFIGKMHTDILSGLPPEMHDMSPRFWEPQGTGGSQAVKNAGQRILVANDWQSENAMQAKYGDSHYNSFVKQAQRQADYVATTNKWGTQAANGFEKLYNSVYKVSTPEQRDMLFKNKTDLKNQFDATQASRDNAAWKMKGRLAQGLMSLENTSMLGNHMPRTLSSGPAMLSQIRDGYGMNIFERATSIAQSFAKLMGNLGDAGVKEMQHWGVSSMSVARDLSNQLNAGNGSSKGFVLGSMAKLGRLAGKLTLADYTTNAWKFAMAENDTRILGKLADKPFDQLRPQTQELLQRYGLHGARWEVARHALDENGRMTPDAFQKVPDEIINQINEGKNTASESQRLRGELAQNLGTLLNDRASMTVAESNASSREKAYGLSDMNSAQGIARNFFYQFHQASIVRQQLLQRTFRSGGGNTSNISGSIQHMLGMGLAGMVGQQLIEMGANRQPLDPTDPKMIGHFIRSTGIAGYYGDMVADFLTSPEPNKMKRIVEGDFLGPSFGTLEKGGLAAWKTGHGVIQYAEGKDRENQYGGKEWLNLLHSLTPDQNLFYAKGGIDYHLVDGAHEFLGDHGYIGTLRQQMRQSRNLFGDPQQPLLGD